MTISWEESYTGGLRQLVGHRKLIIPSARAIIQNEDGDVLFVKRGGSGTWGTPTGSQELEESITDCLLRETKEETGLDILDSTLIAIYTHPRKSTKNGFGDEYQLFEFLFRIDQWSGTLLTQTDETTDAKFFPIDRIPMTDRGFWHLHHIEVFEDLLNYAGTVFMK